jgi:hypothetical protein
VTTPIFIFLEWSKTLHVHVDASPITLGVILTHPGEGSIDHPISFASRNLYDVEHNYTTSEQEGLDMVYSLQKLFHYMLGSIFKFFSDHFSLKYIFNNIVLGGLICRWFLLFQEFDFEVVVKPRKHNFGLDHLSCIEIGEAANSINEELPDAQIFHIEAVPL